MRSWSAIKKRLKSKTYHAASMMISVGIVVEQYVPEIKQVVSDKIGVSWGIAFAIMFGSAMLAMREITKEPISAKGESDVKEPNKRDDRDDQVMDDSDFDDSDSDDESMDSVSGTIDYPAAEIRPIDDGSKETTLRRSAQCPKRVHRGKRRR